MIFRYIVLIIVGIIMFYPMLWMLGGSLKASNNEIFATINFIPKKPSFRAYIKGWNASGFDFGIFMINTYKMVLPKVIGTVISSVITAYGFSRFDFSQVGPQRPTESAARSLREQLRSGL